MTISILIDMNLSPSWVTVLRNAGFEAMHWSQIGPANAPDAVLFAWAKDNKYIVFTHDLDFGTMLAATKAEAPSVFQIRTDDVSPDTLGTRIISLLNNTKPHLLAGAIVVVDEMRERIRLLPLARVGKE